MMTRDSRWWWVVIGGAIATALTGHFDLLHRAFPSLPASVDAQIELLAMITGVLSGVMRMSPLPISDRGRAHAIKKKVRSAEKAAVAAGVAAGAADTAAKASAVAVDAAKIASTESTKAADTVDH